MKEILDKILSVTREELNAIDLSQYEESAANLKSPQPWFFMEAGAEHYRLLAYISSLYTGQLLLDVGSFKGDSAMALSYNSLNRIVSFDVTPQPEIKNILSRHIDFRIGDVLELPDLIKSSPFIILDTYHEGTYEAQFIQRLNEVGYKGLVLFDDIYFNDAMKKMWSDLPNEKYDLSYIGHHSGTGLAVWR